MNTFAALIILNGYLATARRTLHERAGAPDAGMTTLETVVVTVGLLTIATLAIIAITAAVQRRISQIN